MTITKVLKMKSIDQGIQNSSDSRTWAWYGADAPASNDIISIAEVAEQNAEGPEILYDNTSEKGDFSHKVARICELLSILHEKPEALRSWEKLDGFSTLLLTLIDRAPTNIRGYALILQRFGSFIFSDNDSSKEKKNKIADVVKPSMEGGKFACNPLWQVANSLATLYRRW